MNLPGFAVRKPVTALMFFLAVVLLGSVSFYGTRIDLLPDFEAPVIMVLTTWPGAAASDVEQEVTDLVERRMSTIEGLDEMTSTSSDGASAVILRFDWGADLDARMGDARDQVNLIRAGLPDDADDPILFRITSSAFPVMLGVFTAGPSFPGLRHFIDNDISNQIQQVSGVGDVSVFGGDQREIKILVDLDKLKAYDMSISDISAALGREHFNLPAGSFKEGTIEYQLRVPGRFASVEDFRLAIVGTHEGRILYLKDVARIEDGYADETTFGWANGDKSVIMMVTKNVDANTVRVSRDVKAKLEELRESTFPPDVSYALAYDQSDFILRSITQLAQTLGVGIILVFLVTYVFLRRMVATLAICGAIPFSLVVTFIAMRYFDYSINLMTLSALTVAAGMVVDNAIVTADQIIYHVEAGEKRQIAAELGASEVGSALLASTLTTLSVLLPLALLTGILGILFSSLSVVLSLAIVASFIVSLTFIPMIASQAFKRREDKLRVHRYTKRFLIWLEKKYGVLIDWALGNRKKIIVLAGLILVATVWGFTRIGTEMVPTEDSGSVNISFRLPEGTRVEETEKIALGIMEFAKTGVEDLEMVYARGGSSGGGLGALRGDGPNVGTVGIKLLPKKERNRTTFDVAAQMREYLREIPSLEAAGATVSSSMGGGRGGKPIVIELYGSDVNELLRVGERIRDRVDRVPGAVDVEVTQKASRPEIWMEVDRERASLRGVSTRDVAMALRGFYYGVELDEDYWEGEDNYKIWIKLEPEQRHSWDTLDRLLVPAVTGEMVEVSDIARPREALGPPEIHRKDRQRYITIELDTEDRSLGEVAADVEKALGEVELGPGMRTVLGGDVEDLQDTFLQMGLLVLLGIVLVYMVMAGQFQAFLDPFVIMFSIPFALTGSVFLLLFTGTYLSLQGLLGIVMLIGIVVNNAIVLVSYVNLTRARGLGMMDALKEAGERRLRPILMTTLTTTLGMLPMALSRGEGAEIWRPLAFSVIGGLTFSTLVTLVLIPVVYSLVEDKVRRKPRFADAKGGAR